MGNNESIQKEFGTYNDALMTLHKSDVIVGFSNGVAKLIKNRRGQLGKMDLPHAVSVLVDALKPSIGIGIFDQAAESELREAIINVVNKHRISGGVIYGFTNGKL